MIICFAILIPTSGHALRDAPAPWLRALCGSGMILPGLESISVEPSSATVDLGGGRDFTATGTFEDDSTQDLTDQVNWTSSNVSVGTIDSQGRFTAVGVGTTTIQASLNDISDTARVTVQPQLVSLSVSPSSVTLDVGDRRNFTATGTLSDGSTQDLSDQVNWTSSDERVGTINNQGRFTAARAGSTTVRASLDGESDTASVTVREPSLPSCREQFGSAPDFRLCSETSNRCIFNALTDGGNCDQMCRRFGSRCIDARDNEDSSCTEIPGTNDDCQTNRQTEICVCER